jgi:hypothetical protein
MRTMRVLAMCPMLCLCISAPAQSRNHDSPIASVVSQVAELVASDGQPADVLGIAVAISGTTVVAGAENHNQYTGAAYVFGQEGNLGAIHQVAELTASDGTAGDYFGSALAISGDIIVVGSPGGNNGYQPGSVYVFVKPATGWTNMTETATLTASDASVDDFFGTSVSISGNTIVVGARHPNGPTPGAAYVFVEPPSGWVNMTQTAELTPSDGTRGDQFATSVSISGNTVVAGSPEATIQQSTQGSAYVFVEPATGWADSTETAKLVAADPQEGAQVGFSSSIDGNTVMLGAPRFSTQFYSAQGAAYVFVEPATGWKNMVSTAQLTASDGQANDHFGNSVAISGNDVLIGSPNDNVGVSLEQGAGYVFVKTQRGWRSTTHFALKILASDGGANDSFGYAVALENGAGVVGAPGHTVGSNQAQGAAYVFVHQ